MGFASLYPSYGTTMTAALPAFTNYEAFSPFRGDPAQWLPIAYDIAGGHGLACTMSHVFATGTNLVLALDEKLILKIFPPFLRGQFASERSTLAQLRGKLRIAIPEIVVKANAMDGRISSSRGWRVCWARMPGRPCRNATRSMSLLASARPLRRCSASRPGRLRGSSRAGTYSCADRSRDAAHGTSVSDCRKSFWKGWT